MRLFSAVGLNFFFSCFVSRILQTIFQNVSCLCCVLVELHLGAKMMIAWGCGETECWDRYVVERKEEMENTEY